MDYKIINGKLLMSEPDGLKAEEKEFWVKDGQIAFQEPEGSESCKVIDAARKLVMPGLVNMHTHAYMSVMRNYADDVEFGEWLFKRVMPVEDRFPREGAYWTNLLSCMEMIQTGTTSFVDMHMYCGQSPRAARDAGMRAFIGRSVVGEDLYGDGLGRFKEEIEEQEEYESDRIRFIMSPHAIYTCSVRLLEQAMEEAKKRGMLKHIHLSESETEVKDCFDKYGKSPVELLADIGFLDDRTLLAHCVQLSDEDIDILRSSGAHVITNPASNAKLGNGFAPVLAMKERGINLCIGTDGPASNNTLNMFREMGLLSLIHKGISRSPVALPADFVIRAATENAARALHEEGRLGVIKEGARADLAFIDLDAVSLFPNNNIVSSLCYSANGSEVCDVMIDGKFVMQGRQLLTIDKERVYYEVNKLVKEHL